MGRIHLRTGTTKMAAMTTVATREVATAVPEQIAVAAEIEAPGLLESLEAQGIDDPADGNLPPSAGQTAEIQFGSDAMLHHFPVSR